MGILGRIGDLLSAKKRAAEEFEQARQKAVRESQKINALPTDEAKRLSAKILAQDEVVATVTGSGASPDSRLAPEMAEMFGKYDQISFGEMSLQLGRAYLGFDPPMPDMIVIGQNIDSQYVCVRPHEETVYYVWGMSVNEHGYQPESDRSIHHAIVSAGLDSGELPEDLQEELDRIVSQ